MLPSSFLKSQWQKKFGPPIKSPCELGEHRFRALMQASAQIVWVTDAEGRCIEDSPSWREFTGMTYAEWYGSGWLDALHPEDRANAARVWERAVRTKTRYDITYRLKYRGGGWRYTRARGIPMRAPDGEVLCWVGLNDDITSQVQAEAALAESELRFRTLASSVPNFIWMADAAADINYWNDTWYEYTGRTPEESYGVRAAEAIAEEYRASTLATWFDAVERGVAMEIEIPLRRRDGVYRWFTARARPIRDKDGTILRWCGVIFDVDDRRRALESLRQERIAREQFVCALVHDLKNCFATSHSVAEQLLSGQLTEAEQNEFRALWLKSVGSTHVMIDDLLDANRLEAGQGYTLHPREWIDLGAFVRDCVRTAGYDGVEVEVRVDVKTSVHWSPADIARVIQNLLGNAVKYGDSSRSITIEIRRAGARVSLSVHNWGNPIPIGEQAQIFGFLKRGPTSGQRGWGIGLTLVRGIVEAHGGAVTVTSSPDLGTRFTVDLPVEGI